MAYGKKTNSSVKMRACDMQDYRNEASPSRIEDGANSLIEKSFKVKTYNK